ncbi:hypothetical protein J7T55_003729 [Diaporthe amygdali]|uniref:uncharacterized protein n=1 Tax=Phomopsis amygdali TaxID=1214568 RepID=UPI0022FEADD7|nr:uncharacterized protein J7T55_003729 [Diaporthe amygdali]KAJ0117316.1 hypothetical protein J7T55_003729 [Diaporthe amygdali]
MAHYRAHEEQPGLEVAPGVEAPQVVYEQGLEYNHAQPTTIYNQNTQHSPPFLNYNAQQPGAPPPFDPYRQSAYTGSSFSGWTPGSDGKTPFERPPPVGAEKSSSKDLIFRMPKKRFWLIVGGLIAVLVVGIALALGLGLGLNQSSGGSSSASASSTPSASSTSTPESSISCPSANQTTYTSTTKDTEFIIYCAIDYNGNADANTKDLVHMEADRAEDCIDMCASNDSCVGAGWGFYQPDSSVAGSDVCWLKSKLGSSHTAIQDWVFVIKQ